MFFATTLNVLRTFLVRVWSGRIEWDVLPIIGWSLRLGEMYHRHLFSQILDDTHRGGKYDGLASYFRNSVNPFFVRDKSLVPSPKITTEESKEIIKKIKSLNDTMDRKTLKDHIKYIVSTYNTYNRESLREIFRKANEKINFLERQEQVRI